MKKLILALALVVSMSAYSANAHAQIFQGTVTPGSGLYGTEQWASGSSLSYLASNENPNYVGYWYYEYTFTVPEKDISHLIIEVSNNFTEANIFAATAGYELNTFGTQGNSNPGIPDLLYGLKWGGSDLSETVYIVSDRAPMAGNFYSKDGVNRGADVFAYTGDSSGFGDTIVVPDTDSEPIPEPGTILLLGAGLAGLALYSRRQSNK